MPEAAERSTSPTGADTRPAGSGGRDWFWWHLLALAALSIGFESLFVLHGLNLMDEGWPLYAARTVLEGGTLYRDAFFVFPPGHLLAAWIAYAVDPPGFVLARIIYAGFNVALVLALYGLGRGIMPARWAFLACALVAISTPSSHSLQLLFGYRYLVWTTLALVAFGRRVSTGRAAWLLVAGVLTGVAVSFRLTPAFAAGCGIGLAIMALDRSPLRWLRDWAIYGVGIVLVALPVYGAIALSIGPEALWREIFVRPVVMTDLQSLPMPALTLPEEWKRHQIAVMFGGIQFRLWALMYAVYLGGLGWAWFRALADRRDFAQPLLLAVVTWGAIYFTRVLGRSDEPHLASALPPVLLVATHGIWRIVEYRRRRHPGPLEAWREPALRVGVFVFWAFFSASDRPLDPTFRGNRSFPPTADRISVSPTYYTRMIETRWETLRRVTKPGDTILDLSAHPGYHLLVDRRGVGGQDLIMPGTFLTPEEEDAFLERVKAAKPAAVLWPPKPFDEREERDIWVTAPKIAAWVVENYELTQYTREFILVPRPGVPGSPGFRRGLRRGSGRLEDLRHPGTRAPEARSPR